MAERNGLAIAALVLGIVGLFTAGGLGLGSLVGVTLAGAALVGVSRGRRDVAWAALAANVFALLTIVPVGAALVAYRASPAAFASDDDELPEPAQNRPDLAFVEPPPPPPAPPPARSKPEPTATPSVRKPLAVEKAPPLAKAMPAEDPAQPVRIGGSIPEPRKLKNANPVYPPEAIQARVQGVVILECTISPTGQVVKTRVLRGIPLLTEAAVAAVGQWEYTPTLLNGVPVPVVMTVTVNFKLS